MELNLYIDSLKELINKVINNYEMQITKVAIGRANPNLISKIKINYYDTLTPIEELASISVIGALQLVVKPYDIASIKLMEKAILDYKLNVSIEVQKQAIKNSLKDGNAVWFGCDVGTYSDNKLGIMDNDLFITDLTLPKILSFTKKEKFELRASFISHAMI